MSFKRIRTPRQLWVVEQQKAPGFIQERQILVTYQEVTGTQPEVSDVTELIKQLNLVNVLERIARLNSLLYFRGAADAETQIEIAERLFDTKLYSLLLSEKSPWCQAPNQVVIFHRRQLLFLLKIAIENCSFTEGWHWGEEASNAFGKACLMVTDILHPERPEELPDDTMSAGAIFLPLSTFYADNDPFVVWGRARLLWLKIQEREDLKNDKSYVDLNAAFVNATGVSLKDFIAVFSAAIVLILQFDSTDPNCIDKLRINSSTFLRNSVMSQDVFDKVIACISITPSALLQELKARPADMEHWDFSVFQKRPLIEYEPGTHLWYDPNLIAKVFTEGIFWLIHVGVTQLNRRPGRSGDGPGRCGWPCG